MKKKWALKQTTEIVKFRNDEIGWVDKGLVNRIQYPESTRK